ncbi:hypothetical protein CVT24_006392 [Panaeolus cyanescens]|uniref:Uncharacterized protein n=1 Tax=Panaeolus cyanescens TaxID=181874 RepID=A0A409WBV7_9AGAR|nr:hypothetical protein CVT24_006392 [Panaeolus cyanescens]
MSTAATYNLSELAFLDITEENSATINDPLDGAGQTSPAEVINYDARNHHKLPKDCIQLENASRIQSITMIGIG